MKDWKVEGDEFVDEVEVEVEVVNSDEWVLFELLQILPVEELYVGNNWIQQLLNKGAPQLSHIIDSLFNILHQPLYILDVGLSFDFMVLWEIWW